MHAQRMHNGLAFVVQLNGRESRTYGVQICKENLNPVFNESFQLPIKVRMGTHCLYTSVGSVNAREKPVVVQPSVFSSTIASVLNCSLAFAEFEESQITERALGYRRSRVWAYRV